LKKTREFPKLVLQEAKRYASRNNVVVFCEKSSGVTQFRAELAADEGFSLERVAGLLAMQCLVRGYEPDDFVVLVPAEKSIVGRLVARARYLLAEGRAIEGPASLSPRQKEILQSVICNRANKEIASKLNITVRTVKFHISTLLCKFGVGSRGELARRAAGLLRPSPLESEAATEAKPQEEAARPGLRPIVVNRRSELRGALPWSGADRITARR
jgi:DNA-binding CsgD family transcriptional regulator